MPVLHAPESQYAKEMRKWEAHHTQYGPPGRPFVHREFPKMLYLAGRNDKGKIVLIDRQVARDEDEERNLKSRGFVFGPDKAIAACEAAEVEIAKLAAERNFLERRMSEKAQAEAARVNDAAGARHVPVVPETPIPTHRKRGRKPKAVAEAATS